VEQGDLEEVYRHPLHPYTQGLLGSMPDTPALALVRKRLRPIPGSPPDMSCLPRGCPFAPRCPARMHICEIEEPRDTEWNRTRRLRCFARMEVQECQ